MLGSKMHRIRVFTHQEDDSARIECLCGWESAGPFVLTRKAYLKHLKDVKR